MTEEYFKWSTPQTSQDMFSTISFIVASMIGKLATVALVRVLAVSNEGDLAPVGTVTVQPLVAQATSQGALTPHGQLFAVPYLRLQGGANAVIVDPAPGDLGACVFCSRDSAAVRSQPELYRNTDTSTTAPPGSQATYNWTDGLYLGGFLNAVPEQFIRFAADGVEIVSPTRIRLQAPEIELDGPVSATETIEAAGDIIGAGVSLQNHTHGGVQTGGGNTAPPNP